LWRWLGSWVFGISVETGYGVGRDSVLEDFFSGGSGVGSAQCGRMAMNYREARILIV
jgi:hypothetical protein